MILELRSSTGADSFVNRLKEEDFLEFAKSEWPDSNFKKAFIGAAVAGGGSVSVYFANTAFLGLKKTETKRVFFSDFKYTDNFASLMFDCSIIHNSWKKFMAAKFGKQYIEAYKAYVEQYFCKARSELDEQEKECNEEILALMKLTEGGE